MAVQAVRSPSPRIVLMVSAALLLATLIVSSAAHGLVLGDAVAQSPLGAPLRAVIPVTAAPGDSLQPGCFRVVPVAGDASAASLVTARVSLERATSAPRLVVTTRNSVNEPAIRFSVQVACDDGLTQRDYVLLLDPAVSAERAATAATPVAAREVGHERPAMQAAASRHVAGGQAAAEATPVQPPALARPAAATLAAPELSAPTRIASAAGTVIPASFHPLAAALASPAAAGGSPAREPTKVGGNQLLVLIAAAALALAGLVALVALLARRHYAQPEVPQWTHSHAASGPRSFADLSSAPVTLANTSSFAEAPTPSAATSTQRTVQKPATHAAPDPSTIDTLLDQVDSDLVEERAVREAWAAARSDVEREMDGNAILQAIEAAERDLELAPPAHAQSAIERALDDDLLQPQPHR